jgi:uncharacterized membrane protein YeaQ/YmgE (transglycosylase-associated protein family)
MTYVRPDIDRNRIHTMKQLNHALRQIENAANDGFGLLEAIGPADFGTEQLFELRIEAQLRIEHFDRSIRLMRIIAATLLGWVPALLGALLLDIQWLMLVSAIGVAMVLIAFLGGAILLVIRYKSRSDLENSIILIQSELWRRANEWHKNRYL